MPSALGIGSETSLTEMSTSTHLIAWKPILLRVPLSINSRCVGLSHFISTTASAGPFGPSASSNISVGAPDPVLQFKYTPVHIAPVPNPLFSIVRAVAIIFPSGDRASADQVICEPLQLNIKTQIPKMSSRAVLRVVNRSRTLFRIRRVPRVPLLGTWVLGYGLGLTLCGLLLAKGGFFLLNSLSAIRMVYFKYCYLTRYPSCDILPREIAPQFG